MGSPVILEKPYGAAMSGNWESMIEYYQEHFEYFFSPVSHSLDTVLHLAVHSNKKKPLKDLLEIVNNRETPLTEEEFLKTKNKFGNTVLHEATIYGNYEAVRLLVKRCPDLLKETNEYGETPLFTAAGSGEAEIVEFLIRSKPKHCMEDKKRLFPIHRQRKDGMSIFGAAIIGQHFETALLLLELDESLHSLKDKNDITALQLLAHTPSAFKSGFPMGIFERLIYCCLPVRRKVEFQVETSGQARKGTLEDVESGWGSILERKPRGGLLNYFKVPKGCWPWNQKRKHVFALRLAEILIEKDDTWNKVDQNKKEEEQGMGGEKNKKGENEFPAVGQTSENTSKGKDIEERSTAKYSVTKSSLIRKEEIPLLIATRNGIEEIVGEIIKQHPHAIEQLNDEGQSILDVAVMHRQEKIFSLVKEQKIPLARLHRNIDKKGNTLLHNVAVMTEHSGATKPGPALQLQEELQWFEHVRKVIPSHYVTLPNDDGKTARELFKDNHKEQLKNARTWIKETTQSCSTVAALVATVVFAAAYTVPGGSDPKGKPNFINSPYFLAFTVSDVLSLASSLTSLVVFLSLLTSPFELKDFHISLPRKLILGFTFLFLAVITTMISFGATILILIQTESLPVKRHHKVKSQVEAWFKERKRLRDLESGQGKNSEDLGSGSERNQRGRILKYLKVPKVRWLEGFWNQKRKHVFALRLAEILIKKDESLNKVSITKEGLGGKEYRKGENCKGKDKEEIRLEGETSETNSSLKEKIPLVIATKNGKEEIVLEIMKNYPDATNSPSLTRKEHIPLFIATMNGIEEIVWGIINQYPHAVEHLNEEGQSILDVAVKHRQENIFSLVKHQKVPLARLHRVIDKKGNTLLQIWSITEEEPSLGLHFNFRRSCNGLRPSCYTSSRGKITGTNLVQGNERS